MFVFDREVFLSPDFCELKQQNNSETFFFFFLEKCEHLTGVSSDKNDLSHVGAVLRSDCSAFSKTGSLGQNLSCSIVVELQGNQSGVETVDSFSYMNHRMEQTPKNVCFF